MGIGGVVHPTVPLPSSLPPSFFLILSVLSTVLQAGDIKIIFVIMNIRLYSSDMY